MAAVAFWRAGLLVKKVWVKLSAPSPNSKSSQTKPAEK
jgi:hypothetical protein